MVNVIDKERTIDQGREQKVVLNEQQVADYLVENPQFFLNYPSALEKINLPHHSGYRTVSLVERQIALAKKCN